MVRERDSHSSHCGRLSRLPMRASTSLVHDASTGPAIRQRIRNALTSSC
jgi:hypothetical protein